MNNKIYSSDIIDPSAGIEIYNNLTSSLIQLHETIKKVEKAANSLRKTEIINNNSGAQAKKLLDTYKKLSVENQKLIALQDLKSKIEIKLKQLENQKIDRLAKLKRQIELEKEQLKIITKEEGKLTDSYFRQKEKIETLNKEYKKLYSERRKENQAIEKQKKLDKELTESLKREVKSIKDLREQTNALVKKRDQLNITTKEGQIEFERLTKKISANTDMLKKYDAQIGRFQRNVGNYKSALEGLRTQFAQLGLAVSGAFVVQKIADVFQGGADIIENFDKQMKKVLAITNASAESYNKLRESAKALGSTTQYTATQVGMLQEELGKKGFNANEILSATAATLNLAKVAQTDLSQAADVASGTLRGFQMQANETKRVTDVMALSFSSSGLDIEKFSESMKYVAPVAAAAKEDIESTTAALSVLADNSISGSMAGTALRRIFNEVAKSGKSLSEFLHDLADKNISLSEAEKIVGKNAQTALLVLTQNAAKVDELTKKYDNAEGAASRMAAIMDNTIVGATNRLKSAWEGMILSIEDGEGALSQAVIHLLNFMADLLNNSNILFDVYKDLGIAFKDLYDIILELAESLGIVNENNIEAIDIIKILAFTTKVALTPLRALLWVFKKIAEGALWVVNQIKDLAAWLGILEKSSKKIATKFDSVGSGLGAKFKNFGQAVKSDKEILSEFNKILEQTDNNNKKLSKSTDINTKALKEQKEAIKNLNVVYKELNIRAKNNNNLLALSTDELYKYNKKVEAINEEFKYLLKDKTFKNTLKDTTTKAIDIFLEANKKISEQKLKFIDEQITFNKQLINDLEDRLKNEIDAKKAGLASDYDIVKQQIELEKNKNKKLNDEREKALKEQQRINKLSMLSDTGLQAMNMITASTNIYKALSKYGTAGVIGATALISVMWASFLAAKSKILTATKELPAFAEGTEYVYDKNAPKGTDKILARVNEGERIITKEQNKRIGKISNEQLVNIIDLYRKNILYLGNDEEKFSDSALIVSELREGNRLNSLQLNVLKSNNKQNFKIIYI